MRKLTLIVLGIAAVAVAYWAIERQRYSVSVSNDESLIDAAAGLSGSNQDGDLSKLPAISATSEAASEEVITAGSVNPTLDRFGIPSSSTIVLTPAQLEAARRDRTRQQDSDLPGGEVASASAAGAAAIDALPADRGSEATQGGPIDSDVISSAPEVLDTGGAGLAPEDEGIPVPSLPPQATDPGVYDLGPEATDSGVSGPPPEGDPGSAPD